MLREVNNQRTLRMPILPDMGTGNPQSSRSRRRMILWMTNSSQPRNRTSRSSNTNSNCRPSSFTRRSSRPSSYHSSRRSSFSSSSHHNSCTSHSSSISSTMPRLASLSQPQQRTVWPRKWRILQRYYCRIRMQAETVSAEWLQGLRMLTTAPHLNPLTSLRSSPVAVRRGCGLTLYRFHSRRCCPLRRARHTCSPASLL